MSNSVSVSSPKFDLGKDALEVKIRTGKGALGTLLLTSTKIEWLPSPKTKNGFVLDWDGFADKISSIANPASTVVTKRSKIKKKIKSAVDKKLGTQNQGN